MVATGDEVVACRASSSLVRRHQVHNIYRTLRALTPYCQAFRHVSSTSFVFSHKIKKQMLIWEGTTRDRFFLSNTNAVENGKNTIELDDPAT